VAPECKNLRVQKTSPPNRHEVRRYFASVDLFRELDEPALQDLERELEWITADTGDVLMRQGETGDCLYVLLSGRLRAFVETRSGTEEPVGEISPGEAVGEMAILADEHRSATLRTVRPSLLVRLTRGCFGRLEARHPEIIKHIARLLVRRLRQRNIPAQQPGRPLNVGIIAGDPGVPEELLSVFAGRLAAALSAIGSTRHLSETIIDSEFESRAAGLPINSPAGIRLTHWLSAQEQTHRFVLYEAASARSPWMQRAVLHCDRILIVVSGDSPPRDGQAAARTAVLERCTAQRNLVIVHTSTAPPVTGTDGWIACITADDHHHVRMHRSEDFDRIARVLADRAIGLVLGGGGARAFAHIGVIRALNEARIPVDYVGGTGMGALIAAECALDWTVDRMLGVNREVFRLHPLHGHSEVPIVSTLPHKAVALFKTLFEEHCIENQWRNYFAVSCNLTRGQIVVHRQGRFRDCVEASSAMPALNAPVVKDGELLVDGSIINNLPADVMKKLCSGPVIAVDVSPRSMDLASPRIERSGRQPAENTPGTQAILMRTLMLHSVLSAEYMKRYVDVYLRPPVEDIPMFDWMAIAEIAERGYRYTLEELEKPDGSFAILRN
jgi:predicted acylesterase/phospholipase RssA/CRP-like cAMP-binding protein